MNKKSIQKKNLDKRHVWNGRNVSLLDILNSNENEATVRIKDFQRNKFGWILNFSVIRCRK